jgi:hypothetical protein
MTDVQIEEKCTTKHKNAAIPAYVHALRSGWLEYVTLIGTRRLSTAAPLLTPLSPGHSNKQAHASYV